MVNKVLAAMDLSENSEGFFEQAVALADLSKATRNRDWSGCFALKNFIIAMDSKHFPSFIYCAHALPKRRQNRTIGNLNIVGI
jgi:hypothetical protein